MIAEVIVDIPSSEVDKIFDYNIPQNLTLSEGNKVIVPFGKNMIAGYVVKIKQQSNIEKEKLKSIIKIHQSNYIISNELLKLCFYLKENFFLKMIDCINLCVPTVVRKGTVKPLIINKVSLTTDSDKLNEFFSTVKKNAKNQIGAVNYLKNKPIERLTVLNKLFGSVSVKKLLQQDVLVKSTQNIMRTPMSELKLNDTDNIIPTKLQINAINTILSSPSETILLHGVTGSGKTEVYMQVISKILQNNLSAIMLVPEISLTPQMTFRFRQRFGDLVAVLHSGLSGGEKFDEWNRIYSGQAKVVVGARSAIFAPVKNLGIIIIDEEHDSSYISDSNPRYNTRDVAIFRSKFNNCPLVLGSATPTIESYYYAKNGEYKLVELPVRVNNNKMPEVTIVNMMSEFRNGNATPFSNALVKELENVIANKKQAILFINRRGFSSFLMCRDCGYVPNCEHCDCSLVYHKYDNELKCHFCGKRYKAINKCIKCGSENIKLGGIGTERVVFELKKLFPDVSIFRMDNDVTGSKNAYTEILSGFEKVIPSILVGTQMIAKGHDFPLVTLVGILDADLSLYFGAYKATENTFGLVTQVSGRAGRGADEGKVILQTYYPNHYVYKLAANYDYKRLYEKEINLREVTVFPPYSKIIRILISSESDKLAMDTAHNTFMMLKKVKMEFSKDFLFLEAMRSPVSKIKNRHRFQIVARFKHNNEIMKQINEICDKIKNRNILCFIEINPQSLS